MTANIDQPKESRWPDDPIDWGIFIIWKISIPIAIIIFVTIYFLVDFGYITTSKNSLMSNISEIGHMIFLFLLFLASIAATALIAFTFVMWIEGHHDDEES